MVFNNCKLSLLLFTISLLLINLSSYAQKDPIIEDLIENIAESSDEEIDYTSLYDDLNFLLSNPLNLNTAKRSDLEKLQVLNDFQINSLLNYLKTNGAMLSIYELQLVHGFSTIEINQILPFITISEIQVDDHFKIKNALKFGNHQLFLRTQRVIEEQEGFSSISDSALMKNANSRYLGNEYRYYTKYKYNYKNKIYWGFTAEKDPGEEFFTGSNPNGFDFYSGHLQINDIGIIKTITLGDFQAKFGEGLVLWSDMGLSKSSYVLNIRKKSQGLKKYSSTNENIFMRGAGTTIAIKNIDISVFYSKKQIDANIQDSIDNEIASVSSFQNTGYHSIPSEIEDENAISEQIVGGNITYNHSNFKIGLTAVNYKYGRALLKDTTPENQFKFQGDQNSNLSLNYQFGFKDFNFFGEEAYSENGGTAFLNGTLINLAPQVTLSALHRYYDKKYQANYSNAFAESSGNSNESGLYFGIEIHPIKHWQLSAYYDTYKFQWIKSGADAPSQGTEWFTQIDYNPTRELSMYIRLKHEEKQVNNTNLIGLDELTDQNIFKLRYQISYRINENLALKNRIETSTFSEEKESSYGYLIYQDVFYDFTKIPLSLNMRYAIFDTDDYDSRIYAYESDILYAFSIPAYYSKGSRFYFNLKYSIGNFVDIWIKYTQTYYSTLNAISSGLTEINGNTKSEIKFQLRIKL